MTSGPVIQVSLEYEIIPVRARRPGSSQGSHRADRAQIVGRTRAIRFVDKRGKNPGSSWNGICKEVSTGPHSFAVEVGLGARTSMLVMENGGGVTDCRGRPFRISQAPYCQSRQIRVSRCPDNKRC